MSDEVVMGVPAFAITRIVYANAKGSPAQALVARIALVHRHIKLTVIKQLPGDTVAVVTASHITVASLERKKAVETPIFGSGVPVKFIQDGIKDALVRLIVPAMQHIGY